VATAAGLCLGGSRTPSWANGSYGRGSVLAAASIGKSRHGAARRETEVTSRKRLGGESSEPVVDETPAVMVTATEARVYRQLLIGSRWPTTCGCRRTPWIGS
jgi:hypothetical protein